MKPENEALVIVDMQQDFMPQGGALPVPKAYHIIPRIRDLIPQFKHSFATRDWHPENHMSFKEQGGLWPKHCVQNTKGARFAGKLLRLPKKVVVVNKGTDPDVEEYSAFQNLETDFEHQLWERDINTLHICGVATEYCVFNTALDAINRRFKVIILLDCIKGIHDGKSNYALQKLWKAGAKAI